LADDDSDCESGGATLPFDVLHALKYGRIGTGS
jgi:hypothetical protein